MPEDEWTPLSLAPRFIGTPDAEQRLERAWKERTIRARGIRSGKAEPVELPAYEPGDIVRINCRHSRLFSGPRNRWVPAYENIEIRKADLERLAREAKGAPASALNQAPQSAPDEASARGLSPAELGRKGGLKSAEKRRDKPWMQFAKDAALRLHKKNPALTLTEIVEKILEEWRSKKFQKVGFRWLHGYLSRLVDLDELPRSVKKRTGSIPK
jgi:hypothetical protein